MFLLYNIVYDILYLLLYVCGLPRHKPGVTQCKTQKNYIHCLHTERGMVMAHEEKQKVVGDYFRSHIRSTAPRATAFNWQSLGYTMHDLMELEAPFSEDEVETIIKSMSSDKAPSPDGFTGAFFKACWEIIKDDVMDTMHSLFHLNDQSFELLNSANTILLPKNVDALKVSDFRPISLIHNIAKIFSKLLANRLAHHLNSLVSNYQSAFIKKRSIHDNFLYVKVWYVSCTS